jgi:hypothetical protein
MSMVEPYPKPERRLSPWQFSVATLILVMVLICWILAVHRWLGETYGWITAIPLGLAGIVGLATRGRALVGFALGSAAIALVGSLLIGWEPSDIRFYKSLAALGAYGGAAGGGLHAIWLRRRWLGGAVFLAAVVIFGLLLLMPPAAP